MPIKTAGKNSELWEGPARRRADRGLRTERSITRSSPDTPNTFITPFFEAEGPSPETDSTHLAFLNTGLVDISGDTTWLGYLATELVSRAVKKKMIINMQTTAEI
jgi:hypothetical protein